MEIQEHVNEDNWLSGSVILSVLAQQSHLALSYFSLIFSAFNTYNCSWFNLTNKKICSGWSWKHDKKWPTFTTFPHGDSRHYGIWYPTVSQIHPLRPHIGLFGPKTSPFRAQISPLRPLISLLRPEISSLRPQISLPRPQISPHSPELTLSGLKSALPDLKTVLEGFRPQICPF